MSKSQMLFENLHGRIVSGRYSPGYRIVVDDVALEFGVSAGPVREALRRLEGSGLIRHKRNVGATVLGVDEDVFKETLAVMAVLEGLASALSAPLLTADDVAALRELNREMAASAKRGDMRAIGELNRSFHRRIYARCPNRYLLAQIESCWDRLEVGHRQVFVRIPLRHQDSIAEHEQLIEMFEQGAAFTEIDEFVKTHKRRTLLDLEASEQRETEVART